MREHDILVPVDVKEFYSLNPENRRSITVIEMINVADDFRPRRQRSRRQ